MRRLISCPQCSRQYDAGGQAPGSRFHCSCGTSLEVLAGKGHEAELVRCSSCGAPRGDGGACTYCRASFTLHERDLNTVCPHCLARISDRARYCHHCATPIVPEEVAAEASERRCPACGEDTHLQSRSLQNEGLSLLECPHCAGLWVGSEVLRHLEERAKSRAVEPSTRLAGPEPSKLPPLPATPGAPLYRPCTVCGKLMNRENYGRRSGVIVDRCREHGVWFDDRELAHILRWLRQGGHAKAEALQREAAKVEERRRTLSAPTRPFDAPSGGTGAAWSLLETLGELILWIV